MKCKLLDHFFLWRLHTLFVMLLALISVPSELYAQTGMITGTVTSSEDGQPLPGVNITIQGTNTGTVSDLDGNYTITAGQDAVLIFSSIGFVTQEAVVGTRAKINVQLTPDVVQLEEMVVVGYGSVKKSDLTGAVSSVKRESLTPGANASIEQMLQGRVAGVQISQNDGEPGGAMAIKIRGARSITAGNDPLYVIDGLPLVNEPAITATGASVSASRNPRNPLAALNPNDIASIEILKDASATAIYGSRGANGVVLITTRKGVEGAMKVDYDGYYGTQTVANKLDVLTPQQYQKVLNEIIDAGGGVANERVTEIQGNGVDWQKELFGSAPVQSHSLSLSGGDQHTNYLVSLNYFDQQGLMISSGMERYTARLNLESKKVDKYRIGVNMNTSYVYDDLASSGLGVNENAGAVYAAFNYDPTITVYDENGNFNISPFISTDNPKALALGENPTMKTYRIFGTVNAEYFLLPSLSAKATLGGDVSNARKDVFVDPITKEGGAQGGVATVISAIRDNILFEGTLNFNKQFNNIHSVNAVAGVTTQKWTSSNVTAGAENFIVPTIETNGLGSGDAELYRVGSGKSLNKLLSYLARVNYSLMDKYLITASFRADGSARFGPNNRFGYFPSAAIGWRIKEEDFLTNADFLSDLKLRASYGVTGNQEIPNFAYMTTFDNGPDMILGSGDNSTRKTTIGPSRNPNPDLRWESTSSFDVGIDFGFFNGRIHGSLDYYNSQTSDLLLNLPVPPSSGFAFRLTNIGNTKNYGWEFQIDTRNLTGEFEWNTALNLTTMKNKVTSLGPLSEIIDGGVGQLNGVAIARPGSPLFSYYGYEFIGVWQEDDDFEAIKDPVAPGDMKFRDVNGDSTITGDDRVIIGKNFPDFNWGLNNTFSYKNFTLSAYLEGVHGIELLSNNMVDVYYPSNFRRNKIAKPYLNRWTPENPTNEYPSFVNPNVYGSSQVNTKTVEDASYIRLQNVRLNYNFPVRFGFIRNLSAYISGQNLLTITNYSGVDPGVNANGGSVIRIDYNAYPLARTYMAGLQIGL